MLIQNPHIEEVIEEENVLQVSYEGGEGRVKKEIAFKLIVEIMPLKKKIIQSTYKKFIQSKISSEETNKN